MPVDAPRTPRYRETPTRGTARIGADGTGPRHRRRAALDALPNAGRFPHGPSDAAPMPVYSVARIRPTTDAPAAGGASASAPCRTRAGFGTDRAISPGGNACCRRGRYRGAGGATGTAGPDGFSPGPRCGVPEGPPLPQVADRPRPAARRRAFEDRPVAPVPEWPLGIVEGAPPPRRSPSPPSRSHPRGRIRCAGFGRASTPVAVTGGRPTANAFRSTAHGERRPAAGGR